MSSDPASAKLSWQPTPDGALGVLRSPLAWRGCTLCSMKATLLAFTAVVLLSGCRSVEKREVPVAYPLPPVPLSQFVRGPADGIYSLPESVVSQYNGLDLKVIIVSGGKIRLSCLGSDGQVGTNNWNYVEFKPILPSEEALQGIASGTTEQEIERSFGKPTWVQPPDFRWKESMSGQARVAQYTWFTVSPGSELIFMRLIASYRRTEDGAYAIKHLHWVEWQNRKLSSNPYQHAPDRSQAFGSAPFGG